VLEEVAADFGSSVAKELWSVEVTENGGRGRSYICGQSLIWSAPELDFNLERAGAEIWSEARESLLTKAATAEDRVAFSRMVRS
jgi:hypothetical protein